MADKPRTATESIAGRRPCQEDSVLCEPLANGRLLVAVADGMGGHAAGEVASALALEVLQSELEAGAELGEAVRRANTAVHEKSREPGKHGMGTTLVAMLLDGGSYHLANVGDSRAYLLTENGIRQLTNDHSFVAEAMARGQSEEEATSSKWKDALTRSIGTDEAVEVDTFGPFDVEADTAMLLCSDGLYKSLSDIQLLDIFSRSGGPRGAAQSLVSEAYEAGSDDNITAAIAEFGEVPRRLSAGTMPLEWEPPSDDDSPAASAGEEEENAEKTAEPDQADAESISESHEAAEADRAPPAATGGPAADEQPGLPAGLILGTIAVVVLLVILAVVM
jgi:protein phosphatase